MLKLAVQSKHAALAKLPNGMLVTREKALAAGYTIAKDDAAATEIRATKDGLSGASGAYLDKLLALPEGKDRPLACSRIAAKHSAATMPLAKAALFLSGLPVEAPAEDDEPVKAYSPEQNAMLKRKVEIHLMSLDRQSRNGDRDARADAIKIRYGLEICATSTMQIPRALVAAGVDIEKLTAQMRK